MSLCDKEVKITDNFYWSEVTASETAERQGIDNSIPEGSELVVIRTACKMEKVRILLNNNAVVISSWYRSPELNKAVGGSTNSAHMKLVAIDFRCPGFGSPLEICRRLVANQEIINFDQIIHEHSWVHIAFTPSPDSPARRSVLTLCKDGSYAVGITDKGGKPV